MNQGAGWATQIISMRTGSRYSVDQPSWDAEQGPWQVEYDLDHSKGRWWVDQLAKRPWSMWRYRELLPLVCLAGHVDLGEGGTPLIRVSSKSSAGRRLFLKQEGGNPSGSFKDRGLSVAVNRARTAGVPGVQLPSAGNAALSASAYAAAAGIPCRVALPADTPITIVNRCLAYGAEVVRGGTTLLEARRLLAAYGDSYSDLSTFREPGRVEGKKTMAFEIVEQLGWSAPDWIVYPTGGGTGIVGMTKAFAELEALGLATWQRIPRFVMVQMQGCAPLVDALWTGQRTARPWSEPRTGVWGLRVPGSIADSLILDAVRASDGLGVMVPEDSIAATQSHFASREGLLLGPEGAAAMAATMQLMEGNIIAPEACVVVLQTGHPANYL